jgi:hypothetical protein
MFREIFKYLDETLESVLAINASNTSIDQLISGHVSWIEDLDFFVTQCEYQINGDFYSSQAGFISLTAADATHPRIDAIVVNSAGLIDTVVGTPAASPAKPSHDPDTQVVVTWVQINALATTPDGVSNTDIYLEDAEWTSATSSARMVVDSTADPYAGSKSIVCTDVHKQDYVTLTNSSAVSFSGFRSLNFRFKFSKGFQETKKGLGIYLYNGTTRVSSLFRIDGYSRYGFDNSKPNQWQYISIPVESMGISGTEFDQVQFVCKNRNDGDSSFNIDNVKYQEGLDGQLDDYAVLSKYNLWTRSQGSAVRELNDAATVEMYLHWANVFSLTLGGNRTINLTGGEPGQHFTLFLRQDTGAPRLVTWDADIQWAGGTAPTLSTSNSAVDVLSFVVDTDGKYHGALGIADSQ